MPIVDSAIYVDGRRDASTPGLEQTYQALHRTPGATAWIGMLRPSDDELASVAAEFGLDAATVADARDGHQRAKLERHGATLFVVLRPAWYDEPHETVRFGEVHVFAGRDFAVTVRHADRPDLHDVRRRLEAVPALLAHGSEAVLVTVVAAVVEGYFPVLAGLRADIDEVEDDLFDGEVDPDSSKRIYKLLAEVITFQRAITPLPDMLGDLLKGAEKYGTHDEVQSRIHNVRNEALRVAERVDGYRALLENALTLHSTLVTQEQNDAMRRMTSASLAQGEESRRLARASMEQGEQVKRISSWAAILFAPSLIAGIYGMNFRFMPELDWRWGYPAAIGLMVAFSLGLWLVFRRRRWL